MTLAGLNGISRSSSELSFQLRIVSISDSINENYTSRLRFMDVLNKMEISFTLNAEFIAVSDCTFKKNSDRIWESLNSLVGKVWE